MLTEGFVSDIELITGNQPEIAEKWMKNRKISCFRYQSRRVSDTNMTQWYPDAAVVSQSKAVKSGRISIRIFIKFIRDKKS